MTDPRSGFIDLRDASSVELWCAALKVTTAELIAAIAVVGLAGQDVAAHVRELKKRDSSTRVV